MYLVAVRALENELKIQAEKVIHRAGGNFGTRVRSIAQRDLNIETRCVDVLHRPQARGAFAAAIYTLQRQREPSLRQLDVNKADARKTGRPDARRARTQHHDGAGHR